ncbi:MAG: hypothetical protein Q8L48_42285 [Archangium sp.]|nr:hypothetical protein [Archangium sp.]
MWLSFLDSRGVTLSPHVTRRVARQAWYAMWFFEGRAVLVPDRFQERLDRLVAEMPERYRPHTGMRPAVLPVFVSARAMGADRAIQIVSQTLARILPLETFEVTRLQQAPATRPAFRMPLDMLAVESEAAVAALEGEQWADELRQTSGLQLDNVRANQVLNALRRRPRDVLVGPADLLRELSPELHTLELSHQPRLVVTLGDRGPLRHTRLAPAAATLRTNIPPTRPGPMLKDLVLGVAHDLPLHEVLVEVRRASPPGDHFELRADPHTNHGLRMSDAYSGMIEDALTLHSRLPEGIGDDVLRIASLPANFQGETTGMVPISRAERALASTRERVTALPVRAAPEPDGPRRVDLRLKRREFSPALGTASVRDPLQVLWVGRDVTLAANTPYALEVQVGGRHPATLFTSPPPGLDELLQPSRETHLLDVVVFGLDFRIMGSCRAVMELARTGAGPVITFEVKTPRSPGRARLRVCIYEGNHLLQSFVLRADVQSEERLGTSVLEVVTEFSRSDRMSDLSAFKNRELSIAVNDDPSGSHTLTFKRDTTSGTVRFSERQLEKPVARIRALLREAAFADDGQRFPANQASVAQHFDATIFALASEGKALSRALKINAPGLERVLSEVAETEGETLQLVRLRTSYAFPWALLYDFDLPSAAQPICRGVDAAGEACKHKASSRAYCINGFWGARHCIEELVSLSNVKPPPPLPRVPLTLALGVNDAFTASLSTSLRALTPDFGEHDVTTPLIDALSSDSRRPSHLIVLGHLTVVDQDLGVMSISPEAGPALLSTTELTDRMGPEGWQTPRPLVLIMACASGATTVATLNDLVLTVSRCGAAAVVGTECDSYSSVVARFAKDVTTDLWAGGTLGRAMRDFRRTLLRAGNPLGFVFNSVGHSELSFAPEAP